MLLEKRFVLAICWLLAFPAWSLADSSAPTPIPRMVIGVFLPSLQNEVNLSDIKLSMEYWIDEMSKHFNVFDAHAVFFDDIDKLHQAFVEQQIDLVIAPPLEFVKRFEQEWLADGLSGGLDNEGESALTLLVRKDEISEFQTLKGKKLLLPEGDLLPKIYADTLSLRQSGRNSEGFFSSVEYKNKNDRLILDLFFKRVDAVVVYRSYFETMADLNPQIRRSLAILVSYPLKSRNFAFFHKNYGYAERIFPLLDDFGKTARAQQLMQIFRTDRLNRSYVNDLQPIRELYHNYLLLLRSKHD